MYPHFSLQPETRMSKTCSKFSVSHSKNRLKIDPIYGEKCEKRVKKQLKKVEKSSFWAQKSPLFHNNLAGTTKFVVLSYIIELCGLLGKKMSTFETFFDVLDPLLGIIASFGRFLVFFCQ